MNAMKLLLRRAVRHRVLLLEALLVLALGIGANVAIFSVYHGSFLALPFQDPSRLVVLLGLNRAHDTGDTFVSAVDLREWLAASHSFEDAALYDGGEGTLLNSGNPQRIPTATVSPSIFSLLGTHPELGTTFSGTDSAGSEVLISNHLWRSVYWSDPRIIGRIIRLGTTNYVVRGVLPSEFRLFDDVDVWIPLTQLDSEPRGVRHYVAIARLTNGRSMSAATAELRAVSATLAKEHPDTNEGWEGEPMPLRSYLFRDSKKSFQLLFITSALVLAMAIVNVTHLLSLYVYAGEKDRAIEAAMGCPKRNIRFRLVSECFLLAVVAGVVGLGIAYAAVGVFSRYAPEDLLNPHQVIDWSVFAFSLSLGLLSGVVPAILSSRMTRREDICNILRGNRISVFRGRHLRSLPRQLFLGIEVVLCVVLATTAALLTKSFILLQEEDPGFSSRNVLTARIVLPRYRYPSALVQMQFWDRLLATLSKLPGVDGAACMTGIPLGNTHMSFRIVMDAGAARPGSFGMAEYRSVSDTAFNVLGIALHKGRYFLDSDGPDSPAVVIINDSMARNLFANNDPIGKSVIISYGDKKPRRIVGIVSDVKYSGLAEKVKNQVYVPFRQNPWPFMTVALKTSNSPESLRNPLRETVQGIDEELPVENVRTVKEILYQSAARNRFASALVLSFGLVSLALAVIGIHGVVSSSVSRRVTEIAIRIAIGATRGSVLKLIAIEILSVLAAGSVLGIMIVSLGIKAFEPLLYKVHPVDAAVDSVIIALLYTVGVLACLGPAIKAMNTDPSRVMRAE